MGFFSAFRKEKKKVDLWDLDDKEEFITELFESIWKKCRKGEKVSVLNEAERIIYVTELLLMEVNNGGFSQFFVNTSGNFSSEIVSSFEHISAFKTAEICKKALGLFKEELPSVREERMEILEKSLDEEIENALDELDEEFYSVQDEIVPLSYEYVMHHREFFL